MSELFCESCNLDNVPVNEAAIALEWVMSEDVRVPGAGEAVPMKAANFAVNCILNKRIGLCGFVEGPEIAVDLVVDRQGIAEHPVDPNVERPVVARGGTSDCRSLADLRRDRERAAERFYGKHSI